MAAEARAMLDALMGSDRNEVPKSGSNNTLNRRKKSCYDHDVCPLFCAWGVDVFELFTNTKSDLGPNPKSIQESAREEFLNLPDHEKDRLGYEFMLYRKLNDMVRGCDRIVNRNKEKLRMEIAKAAKARGAAGRPVDPASDVSEEMVLEAAEIMADLEIREEEVAAMLEQLMELDCEWRESWEELKRAKGANNEDGNICDDHGDDHGDGKQEEKQEEKKDNGVNNSNDDESKSNDEKDKKNDEALAESDEHNDNKDHTKEEKGEKDDSEENDKKSEQNDAKDGENKDSKEEKNQDKIIKEIKSKLYKLSAEQQRLISSISILTSQTIVPLRDNLQNLNKQLYYVKTDTSSDKTVCEVSGNFMSSRDAEERIAAHYAGKQYVGWKMVRDKARELHKKYAHGPPRGGVGGPPPGRGGGYGHHGGPPPGYGYGGGRGGYGRGGYGGGGRGGGYGGPPPPAHFNRNRRDRSRSRDRGDGPSRSRNQRRRSPSPQGRWRRDRGYGGRR